MSRRRPARLRRVTRARAEGADVMRRWNALKTSGLAALNAKRKAAGQSIITLPSL